MLKATLFGIGGASYLDRELAGFPGQQTCLLLSYLLLNKEHPHHRDQLAAIFWPEHPSDVARKYLRNALWRLRQSLQTAGAAPDDYLFVSEDSVAFVNASHHWLDVDAFSAVAGHYQPIPAIQLDDDDATRLAAAIDLYTGDLLETVYADWCLYQREQLRMLYLNSLHKLMIHNGLNGRYEAGIQYGERILQCDNTREKVHRQLMWLHWLSGNRDAALAQYQRCTRTLHDELNAQPMDETRLLFEQMRTGHVNASGINWSETHPAQPDENEHHLAPLLEQTRRRLFQLQQMIDETRAELHQIERSIENAKAAT